MKNALILSAKILSLILLILSCNGSIAQKSPCEGLLPSIKFNGLKTATPVKPIREVILGSKTATPVKPRDGSSAPYSRFTSTQIAILQKDAALIKENPECKIKVLGHGTASKIDQQLSWDRVNAVIRYLIEKAGISETRFIFEYGTEGDLNTVDLSFTSEDGPQTLPAPHPNLRGLQ